MMRNRRRSALRWGIATVALTLGATSCNVARVGTSCRGGIARDSTNILFCRNGRWAPLMSIADYVAKVAPQPAPTPPAVHAPTTVVPGPEGTIDPTTTTAPPTTTTSTTTTSTTTTSTTTTSTTTTTIPGAFTGLFPEAPIRSWRVNGQGYANVVVDRTVFVGGEFSTATSYDGSASAPRSNVAAFDIDTGELRAGFVADTNGMVRDLAVSGSTLYIAGSFSTVNGVGRTNLAAVDLSSGNVTSWNPRVNATVMKIAIGGGRLYLGGNFNYIGGSFRNHIGAVSLSSGAPISGFAPNIDRGVTAIETNSDGTTVYVGGPYTSVNGSLPINRDWDDPLDFDPTTDDGSMDTLDANGNQLATMYTSWHGTPLDITLVGDSLYVASNSNSMTVWRATGGGYRQRHYCQGDGQAINHLGRYTYGGFHDSCSDENGLLDTSRHLVRLKTSGGADYTYSPDFDQFWGVRAIGGNAETMVLSGQFNWISGVHVGGFAIFKATA